MGDVGVMAPPATRSPMMGPMPSSEGEFAPEELMTIEELLSKGGALGTQTPQALPFNANLAETMAESDLNAIGIEIAEMVAADLESRKEWEQRFKRGLQIIGLADYQWDKDSAPFEGASTAVHPMLAEAGVQSQARAVEELCPAKGPCKTLIMGKEEPGKRDAADRVEAHMNYQLTIEDAVYQKETNKLHLYNTWFGTAYRKAYHDPITDKNVLRYVKGVDLILPYDATSLDSSPRVTHRFPLSQNDYKKYVRAKEYRKVELAEPSEPEPTPAEEVVDEIDAKTVVRADKDVVYNIYEVDIDWNLKGFEEADDVAVPYTISIEQESEKVLAIRRCYKESDPLKTRRTRYAEYWYLPGLGVYGYGLLHMIGSLQEAASDALRALLDSATFANMQGGFKAKDSAVKAGEIALQPGVWKDVDLSAEELQNAFYTPPFKEPSAALFQLLGLLTELGRRFSSTTDLLVGGGENANKAPVGTTIAMLEQGQKVYSSVHKRGHAAVGVELRMLFDLNNEHIPEEGYPYKVPGDDLQVFKADYDESVVSVVPVSDPNIYSDTQRIAQSQALYQMQKENPQDFKKHEVLSRVLSSMKIPNIEDVLIDSAKGPDPMDPVSENIAIATGRPVKAHEGENHMAHLAVLMAFAQHPQFGGLPQAQEIIMPAVIAHAAEHLALLYADKMRSFGVPVPQVNLSAGPGDPIVEAENPQMQAFIAQQAMAMIGQFMASSGLSLPPAAGADADEKLKEAQGFSAFATGVLNLAKAGQTVQQGEAEEAGLHDALNPKPGQGGPPQPPQAPAQNGGPPAGGALPQM